MMNMLELVLKNKLLVLKCILIYCLMLVIISTKNMASAIIMPSKNEIANGPRALRNNNITVTGDSYADYHYHNENNADLNLRFISQPGKTIEENIALETEAFIGKDNIIIYSIGVNDHYHQTPPYQFEATLRKLLNVSVFNNKTIIFHTYMKYFFPLKVKEKYTIDKYDKVLRNMARDYDNVYYIDLSDINPLDYIDEDFMHYKIGFYNILYDRIFDLLYNLENQNS